jgi:hypothetical protein
VKVDSGENALLSDPKVECRNEQPCSEVIPGDGYSDSVPYLKGSPMTDQPSPEVGLKVNG